MLITLISHIKFYVVSPMYGYVLYSDGDIEKKEIK